MGEVSGSRYAEEHKIGADPSDAALYRKAVETVAASQNASTSYVQRQLRIGYNSAAQLIERMEKEGKVGAPDHVGRREVLIDRDGNKPAEPIADTPEPPPETAQPSAEVKPTANSWWPWKR